MQNSNKQPPVAAIYFSSAAPDKTQQTRGGRRQIIPSRRGGAPHAPTLLPLQATGSRRATQIAPGAIWVARLELLLGQQQQWQDPLSTGPGQPFAANQRGAKIHLRKQMYQSAGII